MYQVAQFYLLNTIFFLKHLSLYILIYYMALSHKDWEPPNAQLWMAEMDIYRGLDFPI